MEITKHGNIFSFVQNTPPLAADIQSSGNMDKLNAASKVDYTTITLLVWQRQLDFIPLVEYAAQLERNDLSALAAALYQTWLQRNATPPNPNLPFAAFNLGVLLAAEGDIAGARDAYLKAIEHTPSFLPPRINLGLVFERLGHLDEAIACWQWVEQHVSSNKTDERAILISALNNLGRLQGIQNNYLSALTALDKSLALEPDQPDLLAIYPLLMQNLHLIERSEGTIPGGLRNDAPPPATTSFCPVCNNQNVHWLPIPDYFIKSWEQYGYTYANSSEMTALDTYQCPICGASDRERMYAFFLKIISNKNWTTSKPELMLHFAPEQALSKHILQANYFIHYKTLDMAMPGVDFHVDLQHLPFNEDICDFFICSHVLEHVTDDRKAMKELFRITKPGGCGLLMAPICMDIKQTLEDPSLFNENERWHLFGQNDHVRLYSHDDYVSRIEESGFYLQQMTQHDFGAEIFRQLGLKSSSILYVVSKGYE
ncbi:hypothetical protein FACS189497_12410 [Betaproteobacteria bacterium]|nr:hypothetical protein FACS189488_08810 [Betaproteobacteria bacterium]GHU31526.1 hypothetical protein FACS189497_12410 [Betaproteobacteria bacterium]